MVTDIFSSMVFDDATMEARLPKETYKALVTTVLRSPVGVVCVDALTGEVYAAWGDFR